MSPFIPPDHAKWLEFVSVVPKLNEALGSGKRKFNVPQSLVSEIVAGLRADWPGTVVLRHNDDGTSEIQVSETPIVAAVPAPAPVPNGATDSSTL